VTEYRTILDRFAGALNEYFDHMVHHEVNVPAHTITQVHRITWSYRKRGWQIPVLEMWCSSTELAKHHKVTGQDTLYMVIEYPNLVISPAIIQNKR